MKTRYKEPLNLEHAASERLTYVTAITFISLVSDWISRLIDKTSETEEECPRRAMVERKSVYISPLFIDDTLA